MKVYNQLPAYVHIGTKKSVNIREISGRSYGFGISGSRFEIAGEIFSFDGTMKFTEHSPIGSR